MSVEQMVIGFLLIACILSARLLLDLANRVLWLSDILLLAALGVALVLGEELLPFAALLLVQGLSQFLKSHAAIFTSILAVGLLGLILWPPWQVLVIAGLTVLPLYFLLDVFSLLIVNNERLTEKSEENAKLREQMANQRRMGQDMEHAARLEERNRMAARIHDEIGHGVSGSILLLEGAKLTMEKDPEKAKEALETATENLRLAVDDIRAALREERPEKSESSLARIAATLSQFEAEHPNVQTELSTEGDMESIPLLVWVCLQENLKETLTNLLKHSNATRFTVSVSYQNQLVRAAFQDNGEAEDFEPDMGLASIEERCAMCHGRCFFTAGPRGFSTVMTFTRKRE